MEINITEIIPLQRASFFVFWVLAAYSVVLFSMAVDYLSAFLRCRKLHEKWVSDKQKRTADKAQKYFLPMLALTFIDILCLVVTKYPVFTLLLGAFNAFTEWLSVFEKTHTKEEQREAARTMNVILKNKDELARVLADLLNKEVNK